MQKPAAAQRVLTDRLRAVGHQDCAGRGQIAEPADDRIADGEAGVVFEGIENVVVAHVTEVRFPHRRKRCEQFGFGDDGAVGRVDRHHQ
ncbi:hypothetical protein O4328_32490 [Rhodococcus opacus]|uniref:Uncharacterized protein n=1 Tax=Rhodococcus opacus TaxID=37919 RepID=A0AAX3Y8U1_RHOOP|nr:hypothetical protein [Rhodococcus opacus]MCZ4588331.1 hypothetical protein [Rhodococcus opacus]WLF44454.1 hypothetical protein Q5707_21055 [Rhodococcus opacus]